MGKVKRSTKPFKEKKKVSWNKGISKKKNTKKKFFHKEKKVLNSSSRRKSWFDHEEESWNLESCSKQESRRKIVIPEEHIN